MAPPRRDEQDLRPRRPIGELLHLAAPTVAQMASYTVMQFGDTWMLSRVGEREATAAGNSGMFVFSVIGLGMGVIWVVNTLASQSFGQRSYGRCGIYLWQGIWFSLAYSILLLPLLPWIHHLFLGFGHEPLLADQEALYFRITISATLIKLAATSLGQFLLAINRPGPVLAAAICGVSANFFVNWVLIFGHLGFEPMGVAGAAWGTNVSVLVEMTILFIVILRPAIRISYGVLDWLPRRREMRTLVAVGLPSGIQLVADVLAWSLFGMWVMARFGTPSMAANNFMMRYMMVSFIPAFGIAAAVTALVGRYIGMGLPEAAVRRAHLGFVVTALYMMTCGLIFFLGRNRFIGVFTDDPEIMRIGSMLLIFAAIYQLFDAMYIVYNGALRGAGDTFVPAVVTALLCWGMVVAGGYIIARFRPDLGPLGPWLIAIVYGVILGLFMLGRFQGGKWRRICLDQAAHDSIAETPSGRDSRY